MSGIFGAPLVATREQEAESARIARQLGVENVGVSDPFAGLAARGDAMQQQMAAPPALPTRPNMGREILGRMGDALSQWGGGQAIYGPQQDRLRQAEAQRQQRLEDRSWAVEDRDLQLNKPEYFMSGRDRVRYDPTAGQSSVIYDGPEDHETYAGQFGEPGSPEYQGAAQDYILRGNGPTAYGFDAELEGVRQGNRVSLEGVRHSNRVGLRQTPTYSALHPRPSGGGGRGGSSRPTMSGVIAPILAKVARGEALTPAEQNAWSMYRPGRGGGGRAGQGKSSGPTATDPKTGRKVQWNGKSWVPAS